jgi:hypothetical protein
MAHDVEQLTKRIDPIADHPDRDGAQEALAGPQVEGV